MYSVLYVAVWLILVYVFHTKVPNATPKVDGGLAALVMLGFYLSFGAVGFFLPTSLHDGMGLSFGPDWLMRLAQVIGAICAFYVGLRGTIVWGVLIVLGIVGWVAQAIWQFVAHGTT